LVGWRLSKLPRRELGLEALAMNTGKSIKVRDSRHRLLVSLRWPVLSVALALGGLLASTPAQADESTDTVLLTNGGRVRGLVMEEDPQKGTSIKLLDGTVRRLNSNEVKQVLYGGRSAVESPPPVTSPAVSSSHGGASLAVVTAPQAAPPGVLPALDDRTPVRARGPADGGTGKGLITAGLVTLSVGGLIAAVGGAIAGTESNTGGALGPAIGTVAVGGGVFAVGAIIALVGVGVRAGSSSTAMASPPKFAVAPWIGPKRAGLQFTF
jgi:hypothetical protein